MNETAKNPPHFPFAICKGEHPNRVTIDPTKVYRTKAKAQEGADFLNSVESPGYVVDRIPWEDGMVVQDD